MTLRSPLLERAHGNLKVAYRCTGLWLFLALARADLFGETALKRAAYMERAHGNLKVAYCLWELRLLLSASSC
jgi:hypothetical protein